MTRAAQHVRLAAPGDAAAIAAIYHPAVAETAISFELDPPEPEEVARRIDVTLRSLPWLVCVNGSSLLGYAYAGRHRERAAYAWAVEVSAYVHPAARRSGVARALYRSLLGILTAQGFRTALAAISLPNEPSLRLHEAMGFATVGTFRMIGHKRGAWHDVVWLQKFLQQADGEPVPPVPLPDLDRRRLGEWLGTGGIPGGEGES